MEKGNIKLNGRVEKLTAMMSCTREGKRERKKEGKDAWSQKAAWRGRRDPSTCEGTLAETLVMH